MTRDDLPPGLQAAQVAHGAFEFSLAFPEETFRWHHHSDYVVVLSVDSLPALEAVSESLRTHPEVRHHIEVHEPDIDDELTCVVVGPEYVVSQLLATLPLALREEVLT